MSRQEILKFIEENNHDLLLDFYNKTYEKLKSLNSSIDRLTLYLIIVAFLYFISSGKSIQSFQVGPVSIADISVIVKILPVLFSYILLDIVITSGHKAEVFRIVKFIAMSIYKHDYNFKDLEDTKHSGIVRILMPFSYSIEFSKFNTEKVHILQALFGFIILSPLAILIFGPFYLEYYMLREIYNTYSDFFSKICFYLSIWIIGLLIFYMLSNMIKSIKEQRQDLE
ncbi:MAG TPA: hypothetical protein VNI52_10195 [Sphingobacteriaceae bacterium]|nr:hypothetical protein [Sphingobacteriaceae bacterium]